MQASNYVWDYAGTIKIDTAGSYTFCSWSDDGTFIYVDGSKVIIPSRARPACVKSLTLFLHGACPRTRSATHALLSRVW